jgi:uncharacterized membrane protein
MVLEISADAPPILRFAAAVLLNAHVGSGFVGLLTGFLSAVAVKGSRVHRTAGDMFVVSMLVMAALGAAISPFLNPPQWTNVIAGCFTLYLVSTGYMSGARKGETRIERGLMFVSAVGISCIAFAIAATATSSSDAGPAYVFGAIATLAAIGDFKLVLRGALTATQRIARHLWRMSFAWVIATASLFLGQPQVFPASIRGLLFVPVIAVLGFMFFWMGRVRFTKRVAHLGSA